MFKIISQSFLDELDDADWGDDESGGYGTPGVINDTNYEDFLADEREKEEAENYDPNIGLRPDYQPEQNVPYVKKITYKDSDGQRTVDLVYDGIDKHDIIEFGYTTRYGLDAGIRRVEPHYTFVASSTGNEILVSYDVTPGIDETNGRIRAFIVGNIHPNGIRYEGETFTPRGDIMRGIGGKHG